MANPRPAPDPAVTPLAWESAPKRLLNFTDQRSYDEQIDDEEPWWGNLETIGTGKGVKVAILGSGIDAAHPVFDDRTVVSTDFSRSAAGPADTNGTGTAYAGIAAGSEGWIGHRGIARNALIYSAKVIGDRGYGLTSQVMAALRWCRRQQIDIIYLPFSVSRMENYLLKEINTLNLEGVTLVSPVGNQVDKSDQQTWPSKAGTVIGVGACNAIHEPLNISCRGPDVDLAAPGGPTVVAWPSGRAAWLSGTGIAGAAVVGILAVLIEARRRQGRETDPGSLERELAEDLRERLPYASETAVGLGTIDVARIVARHQREAEPTRLEPGETEAEYLQRIELQGLAEDHAANGPDIRFE